MPAEFQFNTQKSMMVDLEDISAIILSSVYLTGQRACLAG